MKKIFLVLVVLVTGLVVLGFLLTFFLTPRPEDMKPLVNKIEKVGGEEYVFSYVPGNYSDDDPAKVRVIGNSCKDLKGEIYIGPSNKMIMSSRLYCLPNIKDIHSFFSQKEFFYLDGSGITFKNGVKIIAHLDENLSDKELKTRKENDYKRLVLSKSIQVGVDSKSLLWVSNTRNFYGLVSVDKLNDHVFDVVVYDYSQMSSRERRIFTMFCWEECEKFQSIEKIRDALLFEVSGMGIALSGAFLFFDFSAPRYIPAYKEFIRNN